MNALGDSGRRAPGDRSTLNDADFRRIASIAREDAGLMISDGKRLMVQARVSRRARACGQKSIGAYLERLIVGKDDDERRLLVSALTTNVTSFFREAHHFATLETDVIPDLIAAARSGDRVRLWSAGCSTGQEAYSLAMTLLATAPEIANADIKVLATDIDPFVLDRARKASFPATEARAIPSHIPKSLFSISDDGRRMDISSPVRRMVTFRELNLHGSWPMQGAFDVVFCRNVLIYFDTAHQTELCRRFYRRLVPGGWLFLGHSERIHPVEETGFTVHGVTTYRRADPWQDDTPQRT